MRMLRKQASAPPLTNHEGLYMSRVSCSSSTNTRISQPVAYGLRLKG